MSATAHQARRRKINRERNEQAELASNELKAAYACVEEGGALSPDALNAAVALEQIIEDPANGAPYITKARKAFAAVMQKELKGPEPEKGDLESINGIGPAKAKKLIEAGITNLVELVDVGNTQPDKMDDLSIEGDWIEQAKVLLDEGA